MSVLSLRFKSYFCSGITFLVVGATSAGYAEQAVPALEQRVVRLESYVQSIDSTILELSNTLNQNIQEYTKGLEASLDSYSQKLQINLDERLNGVDQKSVILDPFNRVFQRIETNTGNFLIAVENVEPIDSGYRLHLNVGNPNYADYQNFKLKIFWGPRWAGNQVMPYSDWRQKLNGAEFSFQGRLEKGMWNAVEVDLNAEGKENIAYLECEMSVSGIELGQKTGGFNP